MSLWKLCSVVLAGVLLSTPAAAQEFTIHQDAVRVDAVSFGTGDHVIVALPGARPGTKPNRNALKKLGKLIADKQAGIKFISISWGDAEDVAASVKHAKANGAVKVSLLGHSRGAEMVRQYSSAQPDGEFDTVILLSSGDGQGIPLAQTKKLFVYNQGDNYARPTAASFEASAEPKQLFALDGDGHLVDHLLADHPTLVDDMVGLLQR